LARSAGGPLGGETALVRYLGILYFLMEQLQSEEPAMEHARFGAARRQQGAAYLLVILFLVLFTSMAAAFVSTVDLEAQKSSNVADVQQARLAAESGLAFGIQAMVGVQAAGTSDADLIDKVYTHLATRFNGTPNLGQQQVVKTGSVVTVPSISLPEGNGFGMTITQVDDQTLQLKVTGLHADVSRQVAVTFGISDDTTILKYAVASRPRVIARGNVHVEGDLCSTWTRVEDAPPLDVQLGSDAEVTGGVKTVLSAEEWQEAGCDEYVDDDLDVSYDEPPIADYTTEDFDTSSYRDLATGSLPPADYQQWEGFPESGPNRWFRRNFYVGTQDEPKELHNTTITGSNNAHFKHCKFTGYTYVEVPNNVVFEDCTFEGPIITGVPNEFEWTTNSLYFKGDTTITNEVMPESTILAPNFNVNIGDFSKEGQSSESRITGILVGGIVDIRDNAVIEGTILSMADLSHIPSSSIFYYGTNLGYWEHDAEESGGEVPDTYNIRIIPSPDRMLPYGMIPKYTVKVVPDSYTEVTP
jgi:hypothetical protein